MKAYKYYKEMRLSKKTVVDDGHIAPRKEFMTRGYNGDDTSKGTYKELKEYCVTMRV